MHATTASSDPSDVEDDPLSSREGKKLLKNITDRAPDVLRGAYRDAVGMTPPKGWSFDVSKIADRLARMAIEGRDLDEFLRSSMMAFVSRCGGGFQKEPKSPFFAGTYLLSEGALEYLSMHYARLKRASRMFVEESAFPRYVYEQVYLTECEFWTGHPAAAPLLDMIEPTPYWLVFSRSTGRMSKGSAMDLDRLWGLWESLTVNHMGREEMPLKEAYLAEMARMRSDASLSHKCLEAGHQAIWHAAMATYQRHGLGMVTMRSGTDLQPPLGLEKWRFHSHVETLWQWDMRWREFLCQKLGSEFDEEAFVRLLTAVNDDASEDDSVLKTAVPERLTPFILDVLDDHQED